MPQLLTAGDDAYMSDITHDGSTVYGKYRHMQHDEGRRPDPFNPDIDKQFVRLLKKQRKQVAARVDACARAAASVSILLDPNDPLELIIHPDGTYSGGILDLRDVRINEPLFTIRFLRISAGRTNSWKD